MDYKIIKKRRKTMTIKVNINGEVIVSVPTGCPNRTIEDFVEKNKDWIKKQQQNINRINEERNDFFREKKLYFLGKEFDFTYEYRDEQKNYISFDGKSFNFRICSEYQGNEEVTRETIRELYFSYLKHIGQKFLSEKTLAYADKLGLEVGDIRIKKVKTHWGSCSSKGNINYNIKLMTLSEDLINYVIIHELCHIVELNHSRKFWNLVENIIPNYEVLKERLRKVVTI